jgi:DNA (cytosine-5)-methyltransferase 1
MRFGSVCSGIEAASVAWNSLGWHATWFSEIEPYPCSALAHHYPDVANLGDMTTLPGLIRVSAIEAPEVLCGGTPCQAFSVAGNRQSLSDDRGNLTLVFCEVANAIDDIREGRGEQPAIIVWENVPGVLSTKDNAFGCFLAELAGESTPLIASGGKWANTGIVVGPRRSIAWRVLDAQYFGLAQRRKRVFVVASARDDIDIGKVLVEFDGVQRTIKPSRETGKSDTRATTVGVNANIAIENQGDNVVVGVQNISPTLRANAKQSLMSGSGEINSPLAISIQGNVIDRNRGGAQGAGISIEDISYTLTTADRHAVAFDQNILWQALRYEGVRIASNQDTVPTLTSYMGTGGNNVPLINVRRLTPRECERLQGFPDDYTLVPHRGSLASDAPRYKALGNSWPIPVVRWIGERIQNSLILSNACK